MFWPLIEIWKNTYCYYVNIWFALYRDDIRTDLKYGVFFILSKFIIYTQWKHSPRRRNKYVKSDNHNISNYIYNM